MIRRFLLMTMLTALALPLLADVPAEWEILSTETIGAKSFLEAHPEWDGRGVLIAVCDTGVALHLPGLLETSDGKPKVIDAKVFVDQGVIDLEDARRGEDERGKAWFLPGEKWLYGIDGLAERPEPGTEVLMGYFAEEDFQNSSGDGDLSDEKARGHYADTLEAFRLGGGDARDDAAMAWFALDLRPEDREAALYVDDGSHGTHVAGICAGNDIDGQPGYDGIAPGAQVMGLKLGNNTLAGGATTPGSMLDSWYHAVEKARELGMPLVIQMSFGVGSENEGSASAEKLIDELLEDNPDVVATVSAGNEGPGISTIGLPAAADHVFAVGALLAKSSARDLYSVSLPQDEMFYFSSRGAELAKPDIVCPGFAASTVPIFEKGRNVYRGTSMAAPQAAGAVALLLSAAVDEGLPIRRDWVFAALQRTAKPVPGYGPLDIGPGLVDVPAAWEIYKKYAAGNPWEPARFRAETRSVEMAEGVGPAVHWRGAYLPRHGRPQEVRIHPVFPSDAPADFRVNYHKTFDISCEASWVRLEQKSVYCKSERPAAIQLRFEPSRLSKPGLYQTVIEGRARGGVSAPGPDFAVPVSVVIPHEMASPKRTLVQSVKGIRPAKVHHTFFRIPPSLGAATLDLRISDRTEGHVLVSLFDPEGREHYLGRLKPDRRKIEETFAPPVLEPGVWELALFANHDNQAPMDVNMTLRAVPALRTPAGEVPLVMESGRRPEAEITVASGLETILEGPAGARILGTVQVFEEDLEKAKYKRKFSVLDGEASVEWRFSLSAEDFNLFTDMAVLVLDRTGKALVQTGLSYRKKTVTFSPPEGSAASDTYTLKIIAATADPDVSRPDWTLRVEEIHHLAEPMHGAVSQSGVDDGVALIPDHPTPLTLTFDRQPPAVPAGAGWLLDLLIEDETRRHLKLPVEVVLVPEE